VHPMTRGQRLTWLDCTGVVQQTKTKFLAVNFMDGQFEAPHEGLIRQTTVLASCAWLAWCSSLVCNNLNLSIDLATGSAALY